MKPSDIFGLVVRSVGVYLTFAAMTSALAMTMALFMGGAPGRAVLAMAFELLCKVAAAIWFLFGAPPIEGIAYPEHRAPPSTREPGREAAPASDGALCIGCGQRMPRGARQCPYFGRAQPA